MKHVIMAGGRATRLGGRIEKGLLEVNGKSLLQRSFETLSESDADEIFVAASPHTPETSRLAARLGATPLETQGIGYHSDTVFLLTELGPFVSINIDTPFIRPEHIRMLRGMIGGKSIAAVVPAELAITKPDPGSLFISSDGASMMWVGLNYVTNTPDTSMLVLHDSLLTVNINTAEDLETARRIARERKL